jgi:hypothetical protein
MDVMMVTMVILVVMVGVGQGVVVARAFSAGASKLPP